MGYGRWIIKQRDMVPFLLLLLRKLNVSFFLLSFLHKNLLKES